MNIDIKLKTYEQLQSEIVALNTNSYLKDLKIEQLQSNWNSLKEINNEAREYLTSYEATSTIQGLDDIENNKQLDEKTMIEMINRHLKIQDKLLSILDKMNELEGDNNGIMD